MDNYLSKQDVNSALGEYKNTSKILYDVLKKIASRYRIDNQVRVHFDYGNKNSSEKVVDIANADTALNLEESRQFQKVLSDPGSLQGRVMIFVGREKILDVQNGQVNTDVLNLVTTQDQKQTTKIKADDKERVTVKFCKEEKLVENTKELIHLLRRLNNIPQNDYTPIASEEHYYWEKDGEVAITSKVSGKELLNNQGITEDATQDDLKSFEETEKYISRLQEMEQQRELTQALDCAPKIQM